MFKKIFQDSIKVISGAASSITLYEFYQKINNEALKTKISMLQVENKKLSEKVIKNEIDELHEEVIRLKIESYNSQIQTISKTVTQESEILSKIDPNSTNGVISSQNHLDNIIKDTKKTNEILDKVMELLTSNKKILEDNDSFNFIKDLIEKWSELLSNLSLEQVGALAHISSAILILLCLFTIIGVVYSDYFLNYLKLEEKYPKIGRFIKIRKMFQHYYLILNFFIIILTLLAIIFVNYNLLLL